VVAKAFSKSIPSAASLSIAGVRKKDGPYTPYGPAVVIGKDKDNVGEFSRRREGVAGAQEPGSRQRRGPDRTDAFYGIPPCYSLLKNESSILLISRTSPIGNALY